MRKYYLVTTEHLEESLWFRDEEDFATGMNHVAIQAAQNPKVRVLSFVLMSNHVHFILSCERIKEISEDEAEALERAIAYVQMNCVAASICLYPGQYPWGTGSTFFQAVWDGMLLENSMPQGRNFGSRHAAQKCRRLGNLSGRERIRLMHSRAALKLPNEWLLSESGFVLPESYVDVNHVESVFRSSKRMQYFLSSSSKARKRLEAEDVKLPAFRDQVILGALPDLLQSLFQKPAFGALSTQEQAETLRQLRFRFSAGIHQAARVCGISYTEAARLLDTA